GAGRGGGGGRPVPSLPPALRARRAPAARLDALHGVGASVLGYFESLGLAADPETLERRAEALLLLGDADAETGDAEAAARELGGALALRERLVALRPDDDA